MIFWILYSSFVIALVLSKKFPDRSTKPLRDVDFLEVVAELPNRPGNIDVDSKSGRIFFTFHPMGRQPNSTLCNVCEWLPENSSFVPFGDQALFTTVLSVRVFANSVFALDHMNLGQAGQPRMYQLDIADQHVVHTFVFPDSVAPKMGNLNDFVISKDGKYAFITDLGILNNAPSLITLDFVSGKATKSLVNHESTRAKPRPSTLKIGNVGEVPVPFPLGVDSIALSKKGDFVFFSAVFDEFMWMVPTRSLIKGDAERFVDVAFPKPVSDGIVVDDATGVLYVTDFEHSAIWMTHPLQHGRHKTLIKEDKLLRWPDGLSIASDEDGGRYLYITCSAVHELFVDPPVFSPPYHILRIEVTGEGFIKDDL